MHNVKLPFLALLKLVKIVIKKKLGNHNEMLYEIERPVKFYMKLSGYSEIILNWMAVMILSIKLCDYDEIKSN